MEPRHDSPKWATELHRRLAIEQPLEIAQLDDLSFGGQETIERAAKGLGLGLRRRRIVGCYRLVHQPLDQRALATTATVLADRDIGQDAM